MSGHLQQEETSFVNEPLLLNNSKKSAIPYFAERLDSDTMIPAKNSFLHKHLLTWMQILEPAGKLELWCVKNPYLNQLPFLHVSIGMIWLLKFA